MSDKKEIEEPGLSKEAAKALLHLKEKFLN